MGNSMASVSDSCEAGMPPLEPSFLLEDIDISNEKPKAVIPAFLFAGFSGDEKDSTASAGEGEGKMPPAEHAMGRPKKGSRSKVSEDAAISTEVDDVLAFAGQDDHQDNIDPENPMPPLEGTVPPAGDTEATDGTTATADRDEDVTDSEPSDGKKPGATREYNTPGDLWWSTMFERLRVYRDEHGNCNVPGNSSDSKLFNWVRRQRAFYHKQGGLSADRIQKLNSIGFPWRLRNSHVVKNTAKKDTSGNRNRTGSKKPEPWDTMFERLRVYQGEHGNCNVPRHSSDSKLFNWVTNQRKYYNMQVLSADRIQRLNSIGFPWGDKFDAAWFKKFEELKTFKTKEGHTNVPKKQRQLYNWVGNTRKSFKYGTMKKERIDLLNGIGFVWQSQYARNQYTSSQTKSKKKATNQEAKSDENRNGDGTELEDSPSAPQAATDAATLHVSGPGDKEKEMAPVAPRNASQGSCDQQDEDDAIGIDDSESESLPPRKKQKGDIDPGHDIDLGDDDDESEAAKFDSPEKGGHHIGGDSDEDEDSSCAASSESTAQPDTIPSGQESNHQAAEAAAVVDTVPSAAVTGQANTHQAAAGAGVNIDSLTLIVTDLSDLLDDAGATKEVHKCERYLKLLIKTASKGRKGRRGREAVVLGMEGEDTFARLIPLVHALVNVLDATRKEDVETFLMCERFLCHIRDKAEKAKNERKIKKED